MKTSFKLYCEDRLEQEEETYVVFGCARGGTSMVAGCMTGLGMHMGNDLPQNYEDPEFVNRSNTNMIATIQRKNKHHKKWGWKYPEAAYYLNDIFEHISNPRLIIVFRDLVAIANKQNQANSVDISSSLMSNMLLQNRNVSIALQRAVPTLAVSYEKAVTNPEAFLTEVSSFTQQELPADTQPLIDFMSPGEYKATFADRYVG